MSDFTNILNVVAKKANLTITEDAAAHFETTFKDAIGTREKNLKTAMFIISAELLKTAGFTNQSRISSLALIISTVAYKKFVQRSVTAIEMLFFKVCETTKNKERMEDWSESMPIIKRLA